MRDLIILLVGIVKFRWHLRLLGWTPGGYRLRLADEELAITGLGHRISRQAIGRGAFELVIHSPTYVPAEVSDSADPRALGMMVTDVTVYC